MENIKIINRFKSVNLNLRKLKMAFGTMSLMKNLYCPSDITHAI